MTRPLHSFAGSSERIFPGRGRGKNVRSSARARDFAGILSWGLHCRIRNSVGLYAWRPPPEELPFTDRGVLVIAPSDYRRATMPQSHSVPLHIQFVQMVVPPIPRYDRLEPLM